MSDEELKSCWQCPGALVKVEMEEGGFLLLG